MWATRLRCPSCPQRYRRRHVLDQRSDDNASPAPGLRRGGCAMSLRKARCPLQGRQHTGEDLEPEVILVTQPVGSTLNDPDLVVEPLDEAERDLVLRPAIGRDAVPVTVNHGSELLIRRQPLPLQAGAPVLEEAPGPTLALVAPQLAEALLQQVGGVQPLVGRQQRLQCSLAVEREVLLTRQQGVFLALDVAPVAAGEPRVLALAHRIEGLAEMAHDVELVEQN